MLADAFARPDQKSQREQKLERLAGSLPRLRDELEEVEKQVAM